MLIRSLHSFDVADARTLVEQAVAGTPYGEAPRTALARAIERSSPEALALVAVEDAALLGIVLYGVVAGSVAGKLHLVAVTAAARLRGVGARLLDAAADDLRARGALLFVAETPDDPVARPGQTLMERSGFVLEGRVADFHREGVDLLLLRREVSP